MKKAPRILLPQPHYITLIEENWAKNITSEKDHCLVHGPQARKIARTSNKTLTLLCLASPDDKIGIGKTV